MNTVLNALPAVRRLALLHLLVLLVAPGGVGAADPADRTITIELDRGEDDGRNFGSLFELRSPEGRPLLGAGFLGAYNTFDRADRHTLHVFEANRAPVEFRALPRANMDSGVYLFDRAGRLHARSAGGGADAWVYEYDPQADRWALADSVVPEACLVAGGLLEVVDQAIRYRGRSILVWPASEGRLGRPYYAQGWIFAWNHFDADDPRTERYLAWKWTPGRAEPLTVDEALTLPFEKKREFPYAVGQWRDDVVLTTNLGGVYRLRDGRWSQLRKHDGKSYQVYASLNVNDSLWLAQYPSGEVWRYDGDAIQPVADHPPVPPGVSRSAREAQSLAIFVGDVYTGVWPWGELWRFQPGANEWNFIRRMFSQPDATDATTHPYEAETAAKDPVANLWGQRVTSLVPLGDSLYISTSAKGSTPWGPKFDFLDQKARDEYGVVYRMSKPGHVAAPLRWADGPTTIEIRLTADAIQVVQDGETIGRASRASQADRPDADALARATFVFDDGLYGPARVKSNSVKTSLSPVQNTRHGSPLRGVYLHLERLLRDRPDAERGRAAIAQALDRCRQAGVDAVMVFANTSTGVIGFPSKVATQHLVQGWSPLAVVREEAKARGMSFQPVLCMMVSGHEQLAGALAEHPDWALRKPSGEPIGYLSAANPEARAWLTSLAAEVVQTFQPDGLWFDYLRYPSQVTQFDPVGQAELDARLAGVPDDQRSTMTQQFREEALTKLAESLSATCRSLSPGIRLGIYSWGPHVASAHRIAQAWPVWVDRGYIDRVNISGYCYRENYGDRFMTAFTDRLSGALDLNRGLNRPGEISFALGLVTSHGSVRSVDEIRGYQDAAAKLGVEGFAYFAFSTLDPYIDELSGADPAK